MRKSILAIGDILILYGALVLTLVVRYGSTYAGNLPVHLSPFSIIFALWILVFYIANLYELATIRNNLPFFSKFFTAMAVNAGLAIAFFYLARFVDITPRANLFIFIILAVVLELAWRWIYNQLLLKSGYRNNTLIIGLSTQAQELYDYLLAHPQMGYNALGIIDVADPSATQILEKLIRQKNIKTLVLGPEVYRIPGIVDILYHLVRLRLRFYDLSKFSERVTGKIPLGAIDQGWFLANLSEGEKRLYEAGKRALDIFFATFFGIIFFPLYLIIIAAIRLDTPGSILYRQTRTGRGGKPFTLIKFRNMIANAEAATGPVWAAEDDNRVTRIGKWLRKSRIDEIPQLWNIFKGEMSFVGPRPERPEFHEKLKREIPFYEERNLVAPGLTGWAQVKYKLDFRGGMTVHDTLEKVQYDLYYVKNRSFLLDLAIILKTINIILIKVTR